MEVGEGVIQLRNLRFLTDFLGANTYYGLTPPYRRAYKVSYNRPWQTRATRAINILFGAEYPMIRWLESQGYDVTYQSGIDTDRYHHPPPLR